MDIQRLSPKSKRDTRNPDNDAFFKIQELKSKYQVSQTILHMLSDIDTCQKLLKDVVINKIEKEMEVFKGFETLKERQKHLEGFINEYIGNFDSLRRVFSNTKYDKYIETDLLVLVSQEGLEDIEKQKNKRSMVDMAAKEQLLRQYEAIRNDITNRIVMLEALNSMDRLIDESEVRIEQYTQEKIDHSIKIKDFNQEVVGRVNQVRFDRET